MAIKCSSDELNRCLMCLMFQQDRWRYTVWIDQEKSKDMLIFTGHALLFYREICQHCLALAKQQRKSFLEMDLAVSHSAFAVIYSWKCTKTENKTILLKIRFLHFPGVNMVHWCKGVLESWQDLARQLLGKYLFYFWLLGGLSKSKELTWYDFIKHKKATVKKQWWTLFYFRKDPASCLLPLFWLKGFGGSCMCGSAQFQHMYLYGFFKILVFTENKRSVLVFRIVLLWHLL